MKSSVIHFAILLVFCSCNNDQNRKKTLFENYRRVLHKIVSDVPEIPLTQKPIDILNIEKVESNQYKIEPLKVVSLFPDNTVLIGRIGRIELYRDRIYIHDDQTHAIHISSKNGEWINTIRRIGKGEGEYLSIEDFTIDKKNNILILSDVKQKKLIYLEINGKFIKEMSFPFWFKEFTFLPSGDLCFLTLGKNFTGYKVLFSNLNGKLNGKAIPITNNELYKLNLYSKGGTCLNQNFDDISLTMPFNYVTYKISGEKVSKNFELNLGQKKLPFSNEKHRDFRSFDALINGSDEGSLFFLGNFLETDKSALFGLFNLRRAYNILFIKEQDKLAELDMTLYGNAQLSFPAMIEQDNFVSVVDGSWVSHNRADLKHISEFDLVLDQLTPASNPVLVFFKIL